MSARDILIVLFGVMSLPLVIVIGERLGGMT